MFGLFGKSKKKAAAQPAKPAPRMKPLNKHEFHTSDEMRAYVKEQARQLRTELGEENIKEMADALRKIDEKTGKMKKLRAQANNMENEDLANTLRSIIDG